MKKKDQGKRTYKKKGYETLSKKPRKKFESLKY